MQSCFTIFSFVYHPENALIGIIPAFYDVFPGKTAGFSASGSRSGGFFWMKTL